MIIVAPQMADREYLTPHKRYKVVKVEHPVYQIIDDQGDMILVNIFGSFHSGGQSWAVVKESA